jgi:amidohydrolase
LHSHPELSFQEQETAKFIAQKLNDYQIPFQAGIAGTGIVAYLEGNNPESKLIALRADIDALPITEANEVPYKSQNTGVMHACGHDAHTASLLGAARILNTLKTEFEGTIKLIFQPGEEKVPGGASLMIQEGVLSPKPQAIIGQHVMPLLPVGKVGFREGMYMASADELYVRVIGKGGHGAMPENCIDPVLIASHIIIALQQIVSRNAPPKIPSVLSFGKVIAQGATNIIPNEVYMEGTFRTFDEEWRSQAHQKMIKIAQSIAEGMGGTCEFEVRRGYPFLRNNPELTRKAKNAAIAYLGEENVVDLDIWLASEDFAYYSQIADACFYRLGTRNESKGIISGVHTPTFDIDEQALEIGAGLMAWLALQS